MSTVDSVFRSAALASGLVSPSQLEYVLRLARHRRASLGSPSVEPIPDRFVADLLVEQSTLTRYQADQLCAGRTKLSLGPYIVTDFIGQGGMGQVFKAVHQVMGRECAVKVLPLERATPETLFAFSREIKLQAQLDCPYLVRAFDAGQDGRIHYLVTEFVPGMDLRRLVKRNGPLPIPQAAGIIMQAALGLEYAHQKGMVHRDVKPGNILVTPDGLAKVSDVGLAGFAAQLVDDPRAGKIVGTADYLSPEQIRTPLDIGPESDVYSLGCTLYYAICGKVPFPGGNTQSKIKRHLSENPIHPRRFQPDLTDEFLDVIADAMEKNPRQRIQTAAEVAARLEPWAGETDELTSSRMTSSPWMAPPVNLEVPLESTEEPNESLGNSRDTSLGNSRSKVTSAQNLANIQIDPSTGMVDPSNWEASESDSKPPLLPLDIDKFPSERRKASTIASDYSRNRWIIAMTIAIIVPPTLVLGAIIGFLIAQGLHAPG